MLFIGTRNLDYYIDIAVSLNGDLSFPCEDEITGVGWIDPIFLTRGRSSSVSLSSHLVFPFDLGFFLQGRIFFEVLVHYLLNTIARSHPSKA
jgi:hypothetical protein